MLGQSLIVLPTAPMCSPGKFNKHHRINENPRRSFNLRDGLHSSMDKADCPETLCIPFPETVPPSPPRNNRLPTIRHPAAARVLATLHRVARPPERGPKMCLCQASLLAIAIIPLRHPLFSRILILVLSSFNSIRLHSFCVSTDPEINLSTASHTLLFSILSTIIRC